MQFNPYLNNIHVKSENQINYLAGGINNIYPPQNIQDDECQDMYNICLDKYPAARTRIGRTLKANPGSSGSNVKYFGVAGVQYLFYIQGTTLKDMTGTAIATGIAGTKFNHVYYGDGNNEYLILYGEGVTPTRHKLPLSSLNTPEIIPLPSFSTKLSNLITEIKKEAQEAGQTITDEKAEEKAREIAKDDYGTVTSFEHMCYHKNRMFGSVGNMLFVSDLQNPMDWTKAYSTGEYRISNCNQITSLISFDDKLIIHSQKNMGLLYGNTPDSRETNLLFQYVSLDNSIGCYDQCTTKVHNSLLYWLYGRSIYEYDGSSIRNIEKATSNNGLTGGIKEYLMGMTINEAKNVSVAASEDKIYFWFKSYHYFLIFDQKLRKWTKELQYSGDEDELYYSTICDSYADLNFSQTPTPIYALTNNGVVYEITGGRRDGANYIRTYGKDEYVGENNLTEKADIPFYFKTKEFKNGVLSKRKSLSVLWFNYDLNGVVNIKITTDDGKECIKENILPKGNNLTKEILIPNDMQNVNSYTFEIYGTGDFTIYAMERVDRTHTR